MAVINIMKKLTIGENTYTIPEYQLPIASSSTLGGVKIGDGLSIDGFGVLSATGSGGTVTSITLTGGTGISIDDNSAITTSGTRTISVNLGYTTNGNNRAVQADNNGNLYVVQTDTNYYHTTGSWSGLTYTATASTGAGELAFTIPTGTDGNKVAIGNHTHGNITNGGDITATAPTIANGDQIVINDNSASKITNGPTFDGSTTTTALTPKGTWESFLNSNSSLSAAKLTGAIPSAVTATTQVSTDNSTKIATTEYVTTAIANLPEPMVFKGSVGTNGTVSWSSLATAAASNEGWTYKVITAHTATTDKPAAAAGDTIISNGNEWIVIPSGDEPSGTVTSVGIANATNGGLSISSSPITTSGTITIGHSNVLSSAQTTQGVYPIKIDKNGHISAYGSVVTIPSITLNNSSTTEPSFYAPTTAGSSGQYLKSNGSGQAPTWASITLPTNIVTGTGTSGQIAVWTDTSTISSGPKITASTSAPTSSNGSNGDFWFTYTE